MQTTFVVSISNDDNRYTTATSLAYMYVGMSMSI